MQLRRSHRAHAAVETGALSDILFFLMLFFLIVSTLASPNAIKLLLPKASTGKTIPRQVITVSVKSDQTYYLGGKQVNLEALQPALAAEASKFDNPSVVLRADQNLPVGELVKVVDVANKLRLPLVLATDKAK